MRLRIYQTFFDSTHYRILDKAFIPFNNIDNPQPELREYPLLKQLHDKNINFDGHWGMLSWRWKEKTAIPGKELIQWIQENYWYDVYIINPYPHIPEFHRNSINQGESDHKGLIRFTNKLLKHLGYNFDIRDADFPLNIISTCHFYIGNQKFWNQWMSFMDTTIAIAKKDKYMHDYLYVKTSLYHGKELINFCFAMERLVSLFLYLNMKEYKVLHYPYQYFIENGSDKEMEFSQIKEKALLLHENTIY